MSAGADAEARLLRLADEDARDEATRAERPGDAGAPTRVGLTASGGSYPTTAAAFYLVQWQDVLGTESEGSSGAHAAAGGSALALNVGKSVPPQGTYVVCTFVRYRWVFRYD